MDEGCQHPLGTVVDTSAAQLLSECQSELLSYFNRVDSNSIHGCLAERGNVDFLSLLQDVHHSSQRDTLSLQFEPVLLPSSTTNFTKIASFTCKGTDFKSLGNCLFIFVTDSSSFCEVTCNYD